MPVLACFSDTESRNLNDLVLIAFRLAHEGAWALRREKLRQPPRPAARPSELPNGLKNPGQNVSLRAAE